MRAPLLRRAPLLLLAVALVMLAVFVFHASPASAHPGHDWPEAPSNVVATPGDGQLTLTWGAPSSWRTYPAAGYQIDIAALSFYGSADPPESHSHADWEPLEDPDTTTTSYTLSGTIFEGGTHDHTITNGTKYHLRIRAVSEPTSDPGNEYPSPWVVVSATPSDSQVQPVPGQSIIVEPTTLTVPVGSRACYLLRPVTNPTSAINITAASGDTTKATVATENISGWSSSGSGVNWRVGYSRCVKGVATGSTTITHTVTSGDTNYNGITVPSVSVTVTAADTKPTVRFLHSQMRVVEGDTGLVTGRNLVLRPPINVHEMNTREITVSLDIAPAPSSSGYITWWLPNPSADCSQATWGVACPGDSTARFAIDYVGTGLIGRQVRYTAGSNDMEFKFIIYSDDVDEDDETFRIYLAPYYFLSNRGILDNTEVCAGACTGRTADNSSMIVRILDDDGTVGGSGSGSSGTESPLGVIRWEDYSSQNDYSDLIAKIYQWRNDARYVSDEGHTGRWDRVLLALGEAVADTTLEPMAALEAQGYADRGWARWVEVAAALSELEAAAR